MKTFQTFDIEADYNVLHNRFPNHKDAPVIGITGNFSDGNLTLAPGYYTSILKAGGIPFIIPPFENTDIMISLLDSLDGLLLTGGGDINPLFLHEEPVKELHNINPYRDRQELLLTRLAANRQIPILGICRGMQIMNVALGGSIYQDIHVQMEGTRIKHSQDIYFVKLAKLQIYKSASLCRTVFDNIEILRREKHNIQNTKQLTRFFDRHFIDGHTLCTVFSQMHVNPVFLVIFFDNCPDMCLILAKPDHFLVLASLMGLCSTAQICSLKYIGLALGIIAVDYVGFTVKADIQFFVISEITQLD